MKVQELFDVECDVCNRHLKDFGGGICIDEDDAIELAQSQGWQYIQERNENYCPLCKRDKESEGKIFEGLPPLCYSTLNSTGEVIIIKRGESGYFPIKDQTGLTDIDLLNKNLGVTKAQVEAMKIGSMFGWHVAGANPAEYDENGRFKENAL